MVHLCARGGWTLAFTSTLNQVKRLPIACCRRYRAIHLNAGTGARMARFGRSVLRESVKTAFKICGCQALLRGALSRC